MKHGQLDITKGSLSCHAKYLPASLHYQQCKLTKEKISLTASRVRHRFFFLEQKHQIYFSHTGCVLESTYSLVVASRGMYNIIYLNISSVCQILSQPASLSDIPAAQENPKYSSRLEASQIFLQSESLSDVSLKACQIFLQPRSLLDIPPALWLFRYCASIVAFQIYSSIPVEFRFLKISYSDLPPHFLQSNT